MSFSIYHTPVCKLRLTIHFVRARHRYKYLRKQSPLPNKPELWKAFLVICLYVRPPENKMPFSSDVFAEREQCPWLIKHELEQRRWQCLASFCFASNTMMGERGALGSLHCCDEHQPVTKWCQSPCCVRTMPTEPVKHHAHNDVKHV